MNYSLCESNIVLEMSSLSSNFLQPLTNGFLAKLNLLYCSKVRFEPSFESIFFSTLNRFRFNAIDPFFFLSLNENPLDPMKSPFFPFAPLELSNRNS